LIQQGALVYGFAPAIEIGHIELTAANPLGVKGMGEGSAIASPAAVVNAVADALAPLVARSRDRPWAPSRFRHDRDSRPL